MKKCGLLAGSDFFLSQYVGMITTCISTRSEISHLTESDYISYSFQTRSFDFCLSLMLDYFNWQKNKLELIDAVIFKKEEQAYRLIPVEPHSTSLFLSFPPFLSFHGSVSTPADWN